MFGVLRAAFGSCFVFCAGRGDAAFVAASPELLVRREGQRASTVALAGSIRRSADPAVDDHLGEQLLRSDKDREEQRIVARRIARALRPHSVWVTAPDEPTIIKVANIQHLATPIRAQLTHPRSAIELAGLLHPTPAVGGEPHAAAAPQIPALEGIDRGWYAGPVGWTDANEDGEFCVALRCALLRGHEARLYAGVGVVRDSDPAAELAETEVKLGALLPILSGRSRARALTSSYGLRLAFSTHSAALRRAGSRGLAGWPKVSTAATLSSAPSRSARLSPTWSLMPFGHEPIPSACAASSMFCTARPASIPAPPLITTATTKAAPRTLEGSKTDSATASTARSSRTTRNVHGWRFFALPARRPASRIRCSSSGSSGPAA